MKKTTQYIAMALLALVMATGAKAQILNGSYYDNNYPNPGDVILDVNQTNTSQSLYFDLGTVADLTNSSYVNTYINGQSLAADFAAHFTATGSGYANLTYGLIGLTGASPDTGIISSPTGNPATGPTAGNYALSFSTLGSGGGQNSYNNFMAYLFNQSYNNSDYDGGSSGNNQSGGQLAIYGGASDVGGWNSQGYNSATSNIQNIDLSTNAGSAMNEYYITSATNTAFLVSTFNVSTNGVISDTVASVPEPSTYGLLLLGGLALGVVAFKGRNKSNA